VLCIGYPKFSTFGATVGARSTEGRQEYVRYFNAAITASGPEINTIADISAESEIAIVTGFIEKDGGTLYCSVGFFSPEQGLVYKRRKVCSSHVMLRV